MSQSSGLSLVFAFCAAVAALPRPAGAAASPWRLFDRTHGLAGNTVQAVVPDGAGGLWIGTRDGLSRYDGERWQSMTTADGLPADDVHSLAPEADGGLWVGAGTGFGRIAGGRWSRLGLPGGPPQKRSRVTVATDRSGTTWLGHAGGLLRFDRAAGNLEPVAALAGRPVTALLADRDGRLWAGAGGDLWRAEQGAWALEREAADLPSGAVTALLQDSRGAVWCGGERGLAEYDGGAWRAARFGPDAGAAAVAALAEDGEGRLWVGTAAGAGYSDGYEWHWFDARSGLPADEVLALAADGNGSIWVGTARGLARFDASWSRPPAARRDGISLRAPLHRARDGSLYIAADAGFVVQRDGAFEIVGPRERLDARVRCLAEDAAGDLWVGTDQGLVRFDGRVREQHVPEVRTDYVEQPWGAVTAQRSVVCDRYRGLTGAEVTALAADADGGMWVGTDGGLSYLRGGEWTCLEGTQALPGHPVTALLVDPRGVLWVGTADGLWERAEGGWRRHDAASGLAANAVTALLADRAGRIWVGTERGLCRREGEGWVALGVREGLVSARVQTLFEDSRGRLWVGTREGVSCLDGGLSSSFGEQDGLPAPSIESIAEAEGRLWFAAADGVAAHRPDRAPPQTRVKNPPAGTVASPFYLFEFAGADLESPPARLRYSWRIDGGEWSPWSAGTLATVAELANGRHEFEVRALDGELNADPTPAAVAFEVNTSLFDLELVDAAFDPLYASLYASYAGETAAARPAPGRIAVRSRYDRPLRVKIGAFIPGLMDFPTDTVMSAPPGELVRVPLRVELSDRVLDLEKTESRQLRLTLQYAIGGERKEYESTLAVTVVEKSGMVWDEPERIGLYITHVDEAIERFARGTIQGFREVEHSAIVYDNLLRAIELFDALGAHGVRYLPDPANPYGGIVPGRPTLDVVRLPRETLRSRAGDCDDLAVLYAALLENVGIDTALVDVFDHVFVMFDTGLTARSAGQVARDPGLLHVDERGRVWVPVETTAVGQPFSAAWDAAASALASRRFAVIVTKEAWRKYAPLQPRPPAPDIVAPPIEAVRGLVAQDVRLQEEALTSPQMRELAQRVAADPADAAALNALGVLLARRGYLGRAAAHFERVIELQPAFAGGYGNLGNVRYEQGRYTEAVRRYGEALARAELPEVHVELALTFCELGRFDLAREHYRRAMALGGDAGDVGDAGGGAAAGGTAR
ncbi:MAG TPA: two-component regulator propeller domain-containing protein [bacterium]